MTSKAFLEKVKLTVPCEVVFIEERAAASGRVAKRIAAFCLAWFLPMRWLERALGCARKIQLDDLATVIFSSGSTGEPKGSC